MSGWLAREIIRVAGPRPSQPQSAPSAIGRASRAVATYFGTVITRGAKKLAGLDDDSKRAPSPPLPTRPGALWSGRPEGGVIDQLTGAGTATGLPAAEGRRIVTRSLANGFAKPITPPPVRTGHARPPAYSRQASSQESPVSTPRGTA